MTMSNRWMKALGGIGIGLILGILPMRPRTVLAHCDGLDGPVVTAARQALEKKDVSRVLIWVPAKDEAEIREAFERALAVRKLNAQARQLADLYFFETLVRVHRAGEGVPYTGLKPAGRDLGPALAGADHALDTGNLEPLMRLLLSAAEEGMRQRFVEARAARNYPSGNVAAGRQYTEHYVHFIHYAERLYRAATNATVDHTPEATGAVQHEE